MRSPVKPLAAITLASSYVSARPMGPDTMPLAASGVSTQGVFSMRRLPEVPVQIADWSTKAMALPSVSAM